ncbi:MAG: hypothetical protein HN919_17605 [Verrucomicrobia bacterium]|mgnify:FL=1|jgi:hypothetical protein|nr:hypothetical protein [Verrucomicrobiota bacterium]
MNDMIPLPFFHAITTIPLLILAICIHAAGKRKNRPDLLKRAKFLGTVGGAFGVGIQVAYVLLLTFT